MILLDNNQLVIASLFHATKTDEGLTEDLVRHLVLNMYRYYKTKFSKYGDIIICSDGRHYWRKEMYEYYKANRSKSQKKSSVDWDSFYKIMNTIYDEVVETFPYKTIRLEGCEADDVIAIICKHCHKHERIIIVSSDKDFQQLQKYPNVKQYSPTKKEFLTCDDPENFLIEHIIGGDVSDGIPNILSDDDVFVCDDKRQKPCGKKKIAKIKEELSNWTSTENWDRNHLLIDMDKIPEEIESRILDEYSKEPKGNRSGLLDYFIEHKLKNLMDCIEDF